MKETAEYIDGLMSVIINNHRENMYLFLMQIYKTEIDENILKHMKSIAYPSDGNTEITEGYRLIKNYLDSPNLDPLTELSADYAKVFLGAGIVDSTKAAYPYESVYTSGYRLIMQEARDEMLKTLRENKLGLKTGYSIPEDHIFIQFEFMSHICSAIRKAFADNQVETAVSLLLNQKRFIEQHLLNWIPEFCSDVKKFALTDFYKGAARITEEYIRMDLAVVEEMLGEYAA